MKGFGAGFRHRHPLAACEQLISRSEERFTVWDSGSDGRGGLP